MKQKQPTSKQGKGISAETALSGVKKLTAKNLLFAKEYIIDLNQTQAAIRAGYSAKTAEAQGSRLFSNVKVQEEIQRLMNIRSDKLEITSERVLREIEKLAFSNLQDFYNEDGSLKGIHELPRDVAACLLSNKINLTEACAIQEIKLHDKKGSLELLGRHLKLFTDKIDANLSGSLTIEVVKFGKDKTAE